MFATPMTAIVVLVVVVLLIAGIVMIRRATRDSMRGGAVCHRCGSRNVAEAKFCAQCGASISQSVP